MLRPASLGTPISCPFGVNIPGKDDVTIRQAALVEKNLYPIADPINTRCGGNGTSQLAVTKDITVDYYFPSLLR